MPIDIELQTSEGILVLLQFKGIGPQTAIRIARDLHDSSQVFEASDEQLKRLATPSTVPLLRDEIEWKYARDAASNQIAQASAKDVRIISYFDAEFPTLLRNISDPPAILYVKGKLRSGVRSVACVGTREPSYFGREVARRLAGHLAEHNWSIVSGLAIGVDAQSHRAALEAKGHTVAILANGLDTVYPRENRELAEQILESGGTLLSEQPIGTRAFPQHLVQRDRLQSGLSLATFVMQTDIVGGTMHTVRFTLQQRRLLFVPIPPQDCANEQKSRGNIALTQHTGSELANLLKADAKYQELLRTRFAFQSPAIPIPSRDAYADVLTQLESAAESQTAPVLTQTAIPL